MRNLLYLVGVLFMIVGIGCTQYRPLTSDLVKEYGWGESDLRQMQFYLSEDIVLERVKQGGKTEISDGKVKVIDGKKIDQVVIPAYTPGVLLFTPKSDRIAVSFEDDNDEKFLVFGPNPNYGDRYVLLAAEWQKNKGIVTYNGTKYVTPNNSAFSSLMIDMKQVNQYDKKQHVAKGRKLD